MTNTNIDNNIKNQIINQKLNQNNDIFLYIKTNIYYKPFSINNNIITQNGNTILQVYNKGNLFNQNIHNFPIDFIYKYINKEKVVSVGIVKFNIKDILAKNFNKIEVGNCKYILSKYKYYIELESNKYNEICLGTNTQVNGVKTYKLTKIITSTKTYPNMLGIPPQLGLVNITVPLSIGLLLGLLLIGLYFFRKKYA